MRIRESADQQCHRGAVILLQREIEERLSGFSETPVLAVLGHSYDFDSIRGHAGNGKAFSQRVAGGEGAGPEAPRKGFVDDGYFRRTLTIRVTK